MRVCAGLSGVHFTFLSRLCATGRTRDSLDRFAGERLAHNFVTMRRPEKDFKFLSSSTPFTLAVP